MVLLSILPMTFLLMEFYPFMCYIITENLEFMFAILLCFMSSFLFFLITAFCIRYFVTYILIPWFFLIVCFFALCFFVVLGFCFVFSGYLGDYS